METTDLIWIVTHTLWIVAVIALSYGLVMLQAGWSKTEPPKHTDPRSRAIYFRRAENRRRKRLVHGFVCLVLGVAAYVAAALLSP